MKTNVTNIEKNYDQSKEIIDLNNRVNEVIIPNLKAWFISYRDYIDATGPGKKVVFYVKMNVEEYINIADIYPHILLPEGVITEYNQRILDYLFFPPVEFADNEDCYIKNNSNLVINVIVGTDPITEDKRDYGCNKNTGPKKTYLMIDGNGYCKIGKSYSPRLRESTLQSENPTVFLYAVTGRNIEKQLHKEYKRFRHRGEWFDLKNNQIKKIIKDHKFEVVKDASYYG